MLNNTIINIIDSARPRLLMASNESDTQYHKMSRKIEEPTLSRKVSHTVSRKIEEPHRNNRDASLSYEKMDMSEMSTMFGIELNKLLALGYSCQIINDDFQNK